MKKIFSAILLSASITASAQEMHFDKTQSIFNKDKAIPEIRSYEVKDNEDGVSTIYLKLWNGAEYTTPANDARITTATRSTPSASSKFNSLKYITKACDNIDELEFGDFLGISNDEVYDLDGFIDLFYNNMYAFGIDPYSTYKPLLQAVLLIFAQKNNTSIDDIRFHSFSIIYVGADTNGNKIPLSARLIYPYSTTSITPVVLDGFYVDNHCTVQLKGTEPSDHTWPFTSAPYCAKGYMSIMPDLISFGSSAGYSQQFIDKDINGSGVAYSIVAAQQFVKWQKENRMAEYTMDSKQSVINAGTSQGATSALAGTYFIENEMDKSKYNINLKETHVSSGAYDMKGCMDWFAQQDNIVYSVKVPIFFMGLMSAHHDMLKSPAGEQYYMNDYFSPRSAFVYTKETGKTYGNIWQILDTYRSDDNTAAHVCSAMAFYGGKNPGQNPSIHNMLASDVFTVKDPTAADFYDSGIDWECDKMKVIKTFLDANNLNNPAIWKPKAPIKLYATNADDMIPVTNTISFVQNMIPYNYRIQMELTDDVPDIFGEHQASYGSHMAFCMVWYLAEITGLPVNTINDILKLALSTGDTPSFPSSKARAESHDKMKMAFEEIINRMQKQ